MKHKSLWTDTTFYAILFAPQNPPLHFEHNCDKILFLTNPCFPCTKPWVNWPNENTTAIAEMNSTMSICSRYMSGMMWWHQYPSKTQSSHSKITNVWVFPILDCIEFDNKHCYNQFHVLGESRWYCKPYHKWRKFICANYILMLYSTFVSKWGDFRRIRWISTFTPI